MNTEDKKVIENLLGAMKNMPEAKRERFLGFAEGVAAMSEKYAKDREESSGLQTE